jgi:hypothetical protein
MVYSSKIVLFIQKNHLNWNYYSRFCLFVKFRIFFDFTIKCQIAGFKKNAPNGYGHGKAFIPQSKIIFGLLITALCCLWQSDDIDGRGS